MKRHVGRSQQVFCPKCAAFQHPAPEPMGSAVSPAARLQQSAAKPASSSNEARHGRSIPFDTRFASTGASPVEGARALLASATGEQSSAPPPATSWCTANADNAAPHRPLLIRRCALPASPIVGLATSGPVFLQRSSAKLWRPGKALDSGCTRTSSEGEGRRAAAEIPSLT